MNVEIKDHPYHSDVPVVVVTLSEHNLRDLLAQWEIRDYARLSRYAMPSPDEAERGQVGAFLKVEIERDEDHYADREMGPGSGLVPLGSEENPFPPQTANEP